MKKIAVVMGVVFIAAVPAALFVWHFIRQSQAAYSSADVELLAEGTDAKGYTLIIRPPSETDYCCPGVRFGSQGPSIRFERPAEHASTTYHYQYVRSPIGRTAQVDIKAKSRKDGSLSITFPYLDGKWEKGDRIVKFDSEGNRHGSCECLGIEHPDTVKASH